MLNKDNVLFDQSKKENFKLNNHYKTIHRRLKEDWNVVVLVVILHITRLAILVYIKTILKIALIMGSVNNMVI